MKEFLLQQLDAAYNKAAWFAPVTIALAGLTEEEAQRRDGNIPHSIAEITSHLIFWGEWCMKKFNGTQNIPFDGNNDASFVYPEGADWEGTVQKLDSVLSEWRQAISETSEEKLNTVVNPDSGTTWFTLISGMNAHLAYHTGQIAFIRKMQGPWQSGV